MTGKGKDWLRALVATILLSASMQVLAACAVPAGEVVSVQGLVEVRGQDSESWHSVSARHHLCAGDRVSVRAFGRAAIVLAGDILVRLDQNSTLTVMPPGPQADGVLGLAQGAVHVISRFRKRLGVETPFINALVDGTEFTVFQDGAGGRVVVTEGRVRASNGAGEILLLAGEAARAGASGAPFPVSIRPVDAIRWVIHYPPVIHLTETVTSALPDALATRARDAAALFASNQPGRALEALGDDAGLRAVPALRALRASMLLAVGRVDDARPLMNGIPAGEQGAALSALNAIVKLAANDVPGATEQAEAAVLADRSSVPAWLALSYVRQGARDPEGALEAAGAACLASPDDALAWARRAELALSLSRIDEGRRYAMRALEIDPTVARGKALLGFADLLGGNLTVASARFGAALQGDPNEPLTHLGAGLALIRSGQLAEGRREIEIAVILDPSNAELRSTLGRAYLEESRGKVANDQFELAKRLDPASPTPWYYGAYGKLRESDPLGAIADSRHAIELNDNRAVLRSDNMLDSDRAARNADLGLAYRMIGFEASLGDVARAAVEDDPRSGAAHRLMNGAYAEQSGFETARVSELLQARLRSPLGARPQDAYQLVPSLPVLDGPRALSPDETTGLFASGMHHFSAGLLFGSQDTRGASVTASAASEQTQISGSAFDVRSDGFGGASDVAISGQRVELRVDPSVATAVIGELSHTDRSGSNFAQRLFADAGDPDRRTLVRRDEGRLSLRHAPSFDEEWIVSAKVGKVDASKAATSIIPFFPDDLVLTLKEDRDIDFHEVGVHYGRGVGAASWQAGGYAYRADDRGRSAFACCGVGDPLLPDPPVRRTVAHDRVYSSAALDLSRALSAMAGLDYDRYRDSDISTVERFSGKLGVRFRPGAGSEVRAAVIQAVKGDYWQDETLQPTVFNGFEQSFDDLNGTTSTRYALAAQRRLAGGGLLGAEWSSRDLSIPTLGCSVPCRADWRELRHRLFAEYPVAPWAAVSAQWRFESSRREAVPDATATITVPTRLQTELVPLGLWLRPVHALGVLVEAVRMRQKGTMFNAGVSDARHESVWLANLRFRYQTSYAPWYLEAGVRNLFDRNFAYQNTDYRDEARTPLFYPERSLYLRMGVNF